MKYYIPVIGWLISIYEYRIAYLGWKKTGKDGPTWRAFDNTMKGFFATQGCLIICLIIAMCL